MYICFMLFFNYGYPGARCMFWGGRNAGRALTCYALQLVQTASWQQGVGAPISSTQSQPHFWLQHTAGAAPCHGQAWPIVLMIS